jgi:TonB family protein
VTGPLRTGRATCRDRDAMTLTIKDSSQMDSSTKTTPGSSGSNIGQTMRSKPVCLEVPVTIRSLPGEKGEASQGQSKPIREEARTVIVFDNGAVLRLASELTPGQAVIVSNPQGRDVVCRVVKARSLPTVKGYIEIEFVEPVTDFWGIHESTGQSNISNPPAPAVAQPPVVALPSVVAPPQVVASAPPPAPPLPPPVVAPAPETIAHTGNAPSFEDLAGVVRTSPPPAAHVKVPESIPRDLAPQSTDESTRGSVEAARPYPPVSAPPLPAQVPALSGTWESTPGPAWKPSPSGDVLGKGIFSSAQTSSPSSSSGSGGKSTLIFAAAAVVLVALGAGWYFLHQESAAPPAAPVSVASQPSNPLPPVATRVAEPAVRAEVAVEPALPLTPAVSQISSISTDRMSAPTSALQQGTRHQANKVDVKPPDRPVPARQAIPNLKMSGPTAESRNVGRLVDGSVPNITDEAASSRMMATSSGTMLPTVANTSNPPAPPVAFASAGSAEKTVRDPQLASSTRPIYPATARQSNIEGDVVVSADVDSNGKVIAAKALSGPMALRQAAVSTVLQWKYEPALVNGKPAPGQVSIKIQFRLK